MIMILNKINNINESIIIFNNKIWLLYLNSKKQYKKNLNKI